MKKTLKRVLSLALAMLLMAGTLIVAPTEAKAAEVDAKFSLASSDWSCSIWGNDAGDQAGAVTKVNGAGSYSLTINTATTPANDAGVFVIDLLYGNGDAKDKTAMTAQNYRVSELKLTVDGADFAIDTSKIVTGDIEENGNFRIELYNQYGPTLEAAPFDPTTLQSSKEVKVDFTLVETDEPAYDENGASIKYVGLAGNSGVVEGGDDGATVAPGEFDPAGKYNAYIGMQTPNWSFRNSWDDATYGKGTDAFNMVTKWVDDAATDWGITIKDTEVAGNGTYTVSMTDLPSDFANDFTSQDYFNLLFISTDIPLSESVVVSDVKLILDGKEITTYAEAYLDPDVTDYVKILIQNIWNDDVAELDYYAIPSKSIEMQFTISGFNYDKAADETTNDDANASDTNTGDTSANTDDKKDDTSAADKAEGGINPVVVVVIIVVIVAVVAGVVVVMKKKNN